MNESDGVEEMVEQSFQHGMAMAAQIGSSLARMWQERAERARRDNARNAAADRLAYETEKRTALATLGAVSKAQWWEKAGQADIVDAYRIATAWKDHDPAAAAAHQNIEAQVKDRYGFNVAAIVQEQQRIDFAHSAQATAQQWLDLKPHERNARQAPRSVVDAAQRWAITRQSHEYQDAVVDHTIRAGAGATPAAKERLVNDWLAAGSTDISPADPVYLAARKRFDAREPERRQAEMASESSSLQTYLAAAERREQSPASAFVAPTEEEQLAAARKWAAESARQPRDPKEQDWELLNRFEVHEWDEAKKWMSESRPDLLARHETAHRSFLQGGRPNSELRVELLNEWRHATKPGNSAAGADKAGKDQEAAKPNLNDWRVFQPAEDWLRKTDPERAKHYRDVVMSFDERGGAHPDEKPLREAIYADWQASQKPQAVDAAQEQTKRRDAAGFRAAATAGFARAADAADQAAHEEEHNGPSQSDEDWYLQQYYSEQSDTTTQAPKESVAAVSREKAGVAASAGSKPAYGTAEHRSVLEATMRSQGAPEQAIRARMQAEKIQKHPIAHAAAGKGASAGKTRAQAPGKAKVQSKTRTQSR